MSTMNMASNRRKQDEKNLKTLRDFVSLPANKNCFECNQRGPTYVNVTIGSFVCTKCSGMLRGLTPPHRVKSISMATFTQEEVELLKTRGNEYCQQVWLGLYEGSKPSDEDGLQTLMRDKYERMRYYMEPGIALRNSYNKQTEVPLPKQAKQQDVAALTQPKLLKANGCNGNADVITNGNCHHFVADFAHADIFNASDAPPPPNFANFDDNPIFSNETTPRSADDFSIFDLQFTNCGPVYNQVSLFPRMNPNRWHMNASTLQINHFDEMNGNQSRSIASANASPSAMSSGSPSEDKYAALKDLDNAAKSQMGSQLEWGSIGSNSSLYSSPATPASFYSSTASPQSSSYGSPSQGQFLNLYPSNLDANATQVSNPFNVTRNGSGNQNPFRASPDNLVTMISSPFANADFITPPINGTTWTPNPFKIANGHSSNPFL